jgi:molybdopterin/thiamine biosynthesis adenylyltransferase/rhodanese-related sulfurtransferase
MATQMAPKEVDAATARAAVAAGALLVDVREPGECALAPIAGAIEWPLSRVDDVPAALADRARPLVLICAMGSRSRLAAARLAALGHVDVCSVAGGRVAWEAVADDSATGDPGLDGWERQRYARHLVLPEVGASGQLRLKAATVLLVGAGGLGSPVALYLAAAGIGRIRIVDPDLVEASNLQRQVLHDEAGIGTPKVASAAAAIRALNPRVVVEPVSSALDPSNASALLEGVSVAIDGSDNHAAREALNAACVRAGVPMVSAAIERFRGQVSVWWPAAPGHADAPCWACAFPAPAGVIEPPNCAEAGVLGVLPGILGSLEAAEALKLVIGTGESLVGRLLLVDVLGMRLREVRVARDPACRICGGRA